MADADRTLRTIALWNLAAMAVLGCLGACVFAAAERFDVARSIAVAAAAVGAAGALTAVAARRCSGAAMAFCFVLKMAAVLGAFTVLDSWAGLNRRALAAAVAVGVVVSLAIDSWGALRQREGFEGQDGIEVREAFGRQEGLEGREVLGEREGFERQEGLERQEVFGERKGLEERNAGRNDEADDFPS